MDLGFAVPVSGAWAEAGELAGVTRRAEELGYHSLWTFQRLLSPVDEAGRYVLDPQYRAVEDPLAVLAYLAGCTGRVRLGVAVVNAPYYSPALLAKQLTTIDRLSAGRLDVGIGLGWMIEELAAVGAPPGRRAARLEEFLACLRAIWSGEVSELHGEFYELPRCRVEPKPVQQPHPPLLLGGGVEAAVERAGRLADGWVSSSRAELAAIERLVGVLRAAAERAGRDPATLRVVCRAALRLREGDDDVVGDEHGAPGTPGARRYLSGTVGEIRSDLEQLAAAGVTETFLDCNFDPLIGSPDADPAAAAQHARRVLEAFAPNPPS